MTSEPSWQDLLDLVTRLDESSYAEASVEVEGITVRLSRNGTLDASAGPARTAAPAESPPSAASAPSDADAPAAPDSTASAGEGDPGTPESSGTPVKAPLMGVFYRAPSPNAEPYVAPGDAVTADTTIGIIEVMKMMNPVSAGVAGTFVDYVVSDAEPVEFEQHVAHIDASSS